jgi:hypothetical protein
MDVSDWDLTLRGRWNSEDRSGVEERDARESARPVGDAERPPLSLSFSAPSEKLSPSPPSSRTMADDVACRKRGGGGLVMRRFGWGDRDPESVDRSDGLPSCRTTSEERML